MGSESINEKLKRVRAPRVHITYEVETEGASVVKELPFVVGVLGDFSGQPTEPLKPLKDRKFIQIDRDNFNDVMGRMTPGLNLRVKNTLKDDGSELGVQLKFSSMDDFAPEKEDRGPQVKDDVLPHRVLHLPFSSFTPISPSTITPSPPGRDSTMLVVTRRSRSISGSIRRRLSGAAAARVSSPAGAW